MKLRVNRDSIDIIPEGPVDEAYLEEVLGLYGAGGTVQAQRVNASNLSCWAFLRLGRRAPEDRHG